MGGKTISNLSVGLFGDVSHFAHAFGHKATEATKHWAESMKEAGSRVLELTGLAGLAIGAYEGMFDIGKGFKLEAEFERVNVSLGAMIGNAGQAYSVLSDLREFSVKSPFEFPEVASTARKLAAFGTTTDQIIPTIRMLGDIAAGADTSMGELAQLYIRVREEGRLSGREIREFTNAGIPLTDALARSLGKSPTEIRKLLEAGSITFPQVQQAFNQMTGEGGAFNRMLEKQADTMGGLWTTMAHEADEALQHAAEGFAKGFDARNAEHGAVRLIRLFGDMSYVLTNSLGAALNSTNDKLRSLDRDGKLHWYIRFTDWLGNEVTGEKIPAPKIEPPKPLPLEFNPHVRGHELVRWGSAEMQRLKQEWAGQFPKLAHKIAKVTEQPKAHASQFVSLFHRDPLAAGFLAQKAGVFGELMKRITEPPKPHPKGHIFIGPHPETPPKPASFEARRKSLLDSLTSDYKDSDTYVDSHGQRHHYSPEHPNPFQHVLTPDNIKNIPEAWTQGDVRNMTNYQFQIWQLLQNQNSQVANF